MSVKNKSTKDLAGRRERRRIAELCDVIRDLHSQLLAEKARNMRLQSALIEAVTADAIDSKKLRNQLKEELENDRD
jgi:hypothetical protein